MTKRPKYANIKLGYTSEILDQHLFTLKRLVLNHVEY